MKAYVMTAKQTAKHIRDFGVGADVRKVTGMIQGAIDDAVRETYKHRLVFTQDDAERWYLVLEAEVEEFHKTVIDKDVTWEEFDERWGNKKAMHPSQYSFTDLQKRKP